MSDTAKITGYRSLHSEQVALVNQNKLLEEVLLRQLDLIAFSSGETDPRWVSVARTHFQEGFMALNRSIMKPERIHGALDTAELVKGLSQ